MRRICLIAVLLAVAPDVGYAQRTAPLPVAKPDRTEQPAGTVEDAAKPFRLPDLPEGEPPSVAAEIAEEADIAIDEGFVPLPVPKPQKVVSPLRQPAKDTPAEDEEAPAKKPEVSIAELPKQNKPVFQLDEAKQCEQALRKYKAKFTVADALEGEGQCGWPRPLKLTALSRDVGISGNIVVRCEVALALARWSKEVVLPSAKLHLGKKPTSVEISTSYQCRRRNNAKTGKLSEHGFANGVDVMAVRTDAGDRVNVADRSGASTAERAFQAAIRGGACAYFTTVIGPMTNASHANHFHLDLAVRRGGYRLCQ